MATVMITWELGSGIGHLMNLRPIGMELVRRGHRVIAALRDLSHAREVFKDTGIAYVPAPISTRPGNNPFEPPMGFAHVLGNIGFSDERILATSFAAWNSLFDCVRPDLVVADHSPTALLALRGTSIRRVNVGLGFFCPPDGFPLPFWAQAKNAIDPMQMIRDEELLMEKVNRLLTRNRRSPVERLSQVFNDIDEVFLATYPEFDHYGTRPGARYWGHWPFAPGVAPIWPHGSGPRIYGYIKSCPALEDILASLHQMAHPTIIYAGGIEPSVLQRFASPNIRFEEYPLDLRQVAAQCDLALLNAGHGTTVGILLAGKPCLLMPIFVEQTLFAQKVQQLGAGLVTSSREGGRASTALRTVLSAPIYRERARAFAARYSGFAPGQQIPEIVDRIEHHMQHCHDH